jgi:hypothetical protein
MSEKALTRAPEADSAKPKAEAWFGSPKFDSEQSRFIPESRQRAAADSEG